MSPRALDRYAAKRSFTRTPEPPAKVAGERHGPLLFVVQKHAALARLLGRWLGSAREAALGGVAVECARTHSTPSSQL